MSGLPVPSTVALPRVLVLDGGTSHDVFELIAIENGVARVKSPMWFEVGEQLTIRIEQGGKITETTARVRAHVGPEDAKVTELELDAPPR